MPSYFSSWFAGKHNPRARSPSNTSQSYDTSTVLDAPSSGPSSWTRYSVNDTLTPETVYCVMFALGAASGVGAILAWRRWGMRLSTAEWVTPHDLARRRWVRGVVTSVGDADDFRLYHTPGMGWRWPFKIRRVPTRRKELKNQTIHVRIAGVDAPEGAHYGRPGQPHAQESLAWLRKRIQGKTLCCQFIRKDQYGRIVGVPLVPRPFLPLFLGKYFGSSLALEMLRAGTATTYEESGAEYGPWGRDTFLRVEGEAKAARRGMWRSGVDIEMPGQYKKRYAVALGGSVSKDDVSESGGPGEDEEGGEKRRLLSRLRAILLSRK
ncbi:hypothetical protein V8E55_009877 [Tylopilus felleus]